MGFFSWLADKAENMRRKTFLSLRDKKRAELLGALAFLRGKWLQEAERQLEKPGNPEDAAGLVYRDWLALALVPAEWQTLDMCEDAVKREPLIIMFAEFQSPEMCAEAVAKEATVIHFVKEQTEELWKMAVSRQPKLLAICRNQTPAICMEAVSRDPGALLHVREQRPEIVAAAMRKDAKAASSYVWDQRLAGEIGKRIKNGLPLDGFGERDWRVGQSEDDRIERIIAEGKRIAEESRSGEAVNGS